MISYFVLGISLVLVFIASLHILDVFFPYSRINLKIGYWLFAAYVVLWVLAEVWAARKERKDA